MFGFADSVPFQISPNVQDYTRGIYQIGGLMTYHEKKLGIEYKINSGYATNPQLFIDQNAVKSSGIFRHSFDLNDLRDLELKTSWLKCRVILVANSLGLFENVHGAVNENLILHVPKKEKMHVQSFVSIMRADLSELKLGRLSSED